MAAMAVIQANLIEDARAPLTGNTGGTSKGDPNAGIEDPNAGDPSRSKPVTGAGRAGAGILTALVAIIVVGGLVWVSMPDGNVR